MFKRLLVAALMLPLVALASGQVEAPAPASSVTELAAVNVSGVQPGPGLWKVSQGDHVLWILATLEPLPKKMEWQTDEVAGRIAGSQVVLGPPGVTIKSKVGFFGKLFLVPSLLKARKNPGGATLKALVSADDYARWTSLKATYIGHDGGIEHWRPIFAALDLYSAAIKRNGMETKSRVTDTVEAFAKADKVPVESTIYRLQVDDLRGAIKSFTRSGPDDLECFHRAVTGLEQELPLIRARANAWAIGDIAALRALPPDRSRRACLEAMTEAGFGRKLGLDHLHEHVSEAWLAAAEAALAAHPQSFAVLPLDALVGPESVLPALRARGYQVTEPDAPPTDSESPAPVGGAAPAGTPGQGEATPPH